MATPGICIISPRGTMPYAEMLDVIRKSGVQAVKFHIGNSFSTDPIDVEQAIQAGVKTVILRTDDGLPGYSYETVRDLFENPGGISHFSYAYLTQKYKDVNWWLEIGNEPNLAGVDGWNARWWALAVIKELKLNYLGHIDQPWKDKYPNLQWSVCLPTNLQDAREMLTYLDNKGKDDVGDGSIIDYYDAINCHLYGDFDVISRNYDWPAIYDLVRKNTYVHKIHITEMGINDPTLPMNTKCLRYHQFISLADRKVDLAMIWCLGRNTGFPNYEISSPVYIRTIRTGA